MEKRQIEIKRKKYKKGEISKGWKKGKERKKEKRLSREKLKSIGMVKATGCLTLCICVSK